MKDKERELILAIDSSNSTATVSLYDISNINTVKDIKSIKNNIHEVYKEGLRSHSKEILPMIVKLLKELDAKISEVKYIGVVTGPGSFTGIRIGIATAKGLGYNNDVKFCEITSLESLARLIDMDKLVTDKSKVISLIDARHNNMYYGTYNLEKSENKLPEISKINENVVNISELKDTILKDISLGSKIYIVGDAYSNYDEMEDIFNSIGIEYEVLDYMNSLSSSAIVKFVSEYINMGKENFEDTLKNDKELLPSYLKKYEVVKLKDREK